MLDFDIQRCTRRCAATDRPLEPGEAFYSVLSAEGADVVRRDFSEAVWQGPPEEALGWWKSQMPSGDSQKPRLAPNQILLDLFLRWQEEASRADIRYVLTLLMIRRRIFRLEAPPAAAAASEELIVYCPRNGETYHVPVAEPTGSRVEQIQTELGELLFARGG